MITEFQSVYSHFCSKILRIWQKFAVEYCSYKGFELRLFKQKKKYCYFLGVTFTTTYSQIPSVLIGKPQPTRPELMIFV